MAKPNITFQISERDKKLLMLLLAVLIIAGSYFFGYQRFTEDGEKYSRELEELQRKEADLTEKAENINEYIETTEKYIEEYNSILKEYGTGVSQPANIEFLNEAERITDAWIKSVSFSGTTSVYSFGQVASTNPDKSGEKAYSSDKVGYRTVMSLAYEAEYEQWKNLIEFINTYYSKNVIESINMSYSEITGTVSGTMNISLYTVIGSDSIITEPEFNINIGSDNIFEAENKSNGGTYENTNGDYILEDYDYYILLNPQSSAVGSVIMGQRDNKETEVSANSNDISEVAIKISGKEGSYTIEYTVGDSKKEQIFQEENSLDLLIMSSGRESQEDKAGINLSLENTSDKTLNIKIMNDDGEESRVNIQNTQGSIAIY